MPAPRVAAGALTRRRRKARSRRARSRRARSRRARSRRARAPRRAATMWAATRRPRTRGPRRRTTPREARARPATARESPTTARATASRRRPPVPASPRAKARPPDRPASSQRVADDRHTLEAEVLTPEGEIFSGELKQLSTRTSVGEIGILALHAPMVARLVPAELRLHPPDGEVQRYAQGEGWLEVFANRARVLIAEAIPPDQLDAGDLRQRLEEAEQELNEAEDGSAAHEMAERQKRRFETFLEIAEGGRR